MGVQHEFGMWITPAYPYGTVVAAIGDGLATHHLALGLENREQLCPLAASRQLLQVPVLDNAPERMLC